MTPPRSEPRTCPECGTSIAHYNRLMEAEAAHPATEGLDVDALGLAMEAACDALSVTSLSPADAPVLFARLSSPKGQE